MKRVWRIFGLIALLGIVWYLFLKPFDYLVTFKAKTTPGTLNQTIKLWTKTLEQSELLEKGTLHNFSHQIQFNDSIYSYNWSIEAISDSLSKVKVYVKDVDHSFMNKLTIPFSETDFEKRTKSTLKNLLESIHEHLDRFKVKIVEEGLTPASYCAYTEQKGLQIEKAMLMMKDYPLLDNLVAQGKMVSNGKPFIEITNWNIDNDSIAFKFCYPIIETDSLPKHPDIKYGQFNSVKGIKAIYNGNYITSDRAWYELLRHAERNDLKVTGKPVEVFYSNPNMGNDELNWKAEIFMPLQN